MAKQAPWREARCRETGRSPPLIREVARTFILDGLGLVKEDVDARSAPLRSLPISVYASF